MLSVLVPAQEFYDSKNEEFLYTQQTELTLEHSLISIAKWESKWNKPFLDYKKPKTSEESLDYIRCMTIGKEAESLVYQTLPSFIMIQVNEYMQLPMTATWFSKNSHGGIGSMSRDIITNEIVYYWMIQFGIPFECEKWHFNRLLTLIRVCNLKDAPPKKMSKRQLMERNTALNAKRKSKLKTRG